MAAEEERGLAARADPCVILPPEIFLECLRYLTIPEIATCFLVSTRWRVQVSDSWLWRNLYEQYFTANLKRMLPEEQYVADWRKLFEGAYCNAGRVYTFGYGHHGRLGHGDEQAVPAPRMVASLQHTYIVKAAVGHAHSVVLSANGHVYTFGSNQYGQLGLGNRVNQLSPQLVTLPLRDGEKVVGLGAGGVHTLFHTSTGDVYSCGNNQYGQLALGREIPIAITPQRINLNGRVAAIISAAGSTTVVITAEGRALTCGNNIDGRLGHGGLDDEHVLREVAALRDVEIIQVTAGNYHTVFLSRDHRVFTCGFGKHGRLGHGNERDLRIPTEVVEVRPLDVVKVAAGNTVTSLVTSSGKVYCYGGDKVRDPTRLREIHMWDGAQVVDVANGDGFMIGMVDDGRVFLYEYVDGRLVSEVAGRKELPRYITGLEHRAAWVVAGARHSLVVTGLGTVVHMASAPNTPTAKTKTMTVSPPGSPSAAAAPLPPGGFP